MTCRALFVAVCVSVVAACSHAPKSGEEAAALQQRARGTTNEMIARDPGLSDVLRSSAGYAVFPSIGKGAFIVGGAYGKGVLFEHGRVTGYVDISQASVGASLGGQTFSELVVLRDPIDVARMKRGEYAVGANAGVVVLTTGAATSGTLTQGATVFVMPKGGAMVDISVSGQKINFQRNAG